MRRVFQLVPFLEPGDAIGNHARRFAAALGPAHGGYIVERASGEHARTATPFTRAEVDPDDVLVYHVAHSSRLGDWLAGVKAIKVIDYHNITPPEFYRAYDPGLAVALGRALGELESLRSEVALALAHSEYSRRELGAMGFVPTAAVPVLLDFSRLDGAGAPVPEALRGAGPGREDLLFVGRVAPHKRIEDVVKVFALYRRVWAPGARLWLVGRCDSPSYLGALKSFVDRLGVEEVHFLGAVPDGELAASYRSAGVLLSMSEHEGFGAPLLEAMHLGLPVVAYAAAAVPETVGVAGVLLREKRYEEVAALVHLVVGDERLRTSLVESGRARAGEFRPERHEGRIRELIGAL
ncbi:MAG TPA: glycosyltransferase [Actinomycetota bacterium]|nr:glycosyltransferase [Actinomycetota bacterium]